MEPANRSPRVDAFLAGLTHARSAEIQQLRLAILAAEPDLSETVKWNAPNFRYADEDRVTFRLHPGERLQIIFHRGAPVRDDQQEFRFDDPYRLIEWLAPDRGVMTLADAEQTTSRQSAVTELVRRWVRAG